MAFVGGFTDVDNTVFVFSANLAGGDAKYTADSVSHESGHAFGLNHQSEYDADGVKTQEYATGPGDGRAPLMGNSFAASRGVWWSGASASATTAQDDMGVLTRSLGLRPDDRGNDADHATPLIVSGNSIAGSGIIETIADVDYFSFDTGAGTVTATVTPLSPGGNLDARSNCATRRACCWSRPTPATAPAPRSPCWCRRGVIGWSWAATARTATSASTRSPARSCRRRIRFPPPRC